MLAPLPELDDKYAAELAALGPAPRIGVTWRAGVQIRNRLSKLAPMDAIAAALKPVDATIVALQRNSAPGEIEAFGRAVGREIHDLTRLNDDLEAMLALVGHLDDYVCVSNTNVHLRASRGLACRVLVPHPPDYRWMSRGAHTPWFPGTTVYRNKTFGTASFVPWRSTSLPATSRVIWRRARAERLYAFSIHRALRLTPSNQGRNR